MFDVHPRMFLMVQTLVQVKRTVAWKDDHQSRVGRLNWPALHDAVHVAECREAASSINFSVCPEHGVTRQRCWS